VPNDSSDKPSSPEKSVEFDGELLEPYRGYLWALASAQLNRRIQGKVDASDIVQQTLLRAHSGLKGLRDHSPGAIAAWLRTILAAEMVDILRHYHRDKRDIDREKSIVQDLDQSSAGLERWIEADQSSPSMIASRNEQMLLLANAILQIPADQREVVVMKHLKGKTLQQIAEETRRTTASVAGLLRRGLARLRELMDDSIN